MSVGNAEPVVSSSPASTHCPWSTRIWVRRSTGNGCSRAGARVAPVPASSCSTYSGSTTVSVADPGRVSSSLISHPAVDRGDVRQGLRLARLEQLHDARQAVRDVGAGDAAGVEGAHGELRAGLADRLRGDDADRVAGLGELARGRVAPVAAGADAHVAAALHGRAHRDDHVQRPAVLAQLGVEPLAVGRRDQVATPGGEHRLLVVAVRPRDAGRARPRPSAGPRPGPAAPGRGGSG